MTEVLERQKCTGCGACATACPKKCITMQSDSDGFLYPSIDTSLCVDCGACRDVCPVISKSGEQLAMPKAFVAIGLDEKVRLKSSSGGVFTILAEEILENGGVVFGAAFDSEFKVVHTAVEEKRELSKLRGSKYVQSEIGGSYKEIKKHLQEGRQVLFSGTPCQVAGLKSYLKKDYDNLLCLDFICHGVPSPDLWKRYVEFCEEKNDSKLTAASFRDKSESWGSFSMRLEFQNGKIQSNNLNKDCYLRAFLSDVALRPSCYDCSFKTVGRDVDITLADYWDVSKIHPEMFDNKGTSLVLVHSEKGGELLKSVAERVSYKPTELDVALASNQAAVRSAAKPRSREAFLSDIKILGFEKTVNKYCDGYYKKQLKRVINKLKRIIKTAK